MNDFIGKSSVNRNFLLDVSLGKIDGHSIIHKFGVNYAVGAAKVDIWSGATDYRFFRAVAVQMQVVSDDPADTDGGGNAHAVRIYGLDSRLRMISEVVRMKGVTPVNTANLYRRVYRMVVIEGGNPYAPNKGVITCKEAAGLTVGAHIRELKGQTLQAIYTIPVTHTGYLLAAYAGVAKSDDADIELDIRAPGGVFVVKHDAEIFQNFWDYKWMPAMKVDFKSDITLKAESSSPNTVVTGGFSLLLVEKGKE